MLIQKSTGLQSLKTQVLRLLCSGRGSGIFKQNVYQNNDKKNAVCCFENSFNNGWKIASKTGSSKWITSDAARKEVYSMQQKI